MVQPPTLNLHHSHRQSNEQEIRITKKNMAQNKNGKTTATKNYER